MNLLNNGFFLVKMSSIYSLITRGLVNENHALMVGGSLSPVCALSQSGSPAIDHPKEVGLAHLAGVPQ